MRHRLIGYESDPTLLRGLAALGLPASRDRFVFRTDDTIAYARLVAAGGGVGFLAAYCLRQLPGVVPVMPHLAIPALPCWLAAHRELRARPLFRRVYDFLAEAIPRGLAGATISRA
jgi:DNA-binding transcriptional LysR family regulator